MVLAIVEEALQELDSYNFLTNFMRLEGSILQIGDRKWDIGRKGRLFVIGAGKAGNSMARAVEKTLRERISQGLVIVKQREPGDELQKIELVVGGHPLPNEEGLQASRRILTMVENAAPEDLFIGLISGGSSALMSCPVPGITLKDEIAVTDMLLKSSARILEINAVRRHISRTNGGRLAQKIDAEGAEMINLIISDIIEDQPSAGPAESLKFYGTPVAPDTTTLQDARNSLRKYNLCALAPRSIVEYLSTDDPARETPKALGPHIHNIVFQKPADACEAARRAADRMGLPALVLTTFLQGESREAGAFLASVAKEVALNHRPLSPPCALIAGGETTTRIQEASGMGGPSQELALGFALEIVNLSGICLAALDTDGTDGPTQIAGGIADCTTVERARQKGLDVYERLKAHDSSYVLRILGDEIVTGNTGTNLCDLNLIYIS